MTAHTRTRLRRIASEHQWVIQSAGSKVDLFLRPGEFVRVRYSNGGALVHSARYASDAPSEGEHPTKGKQTRTRQWLTA